MKIEANKLEGKALDWAVAEATSDYSVLRISEYDPFLVSIGFDPLVVMPSDNRCWYMPFGGDGWSPSTLWSQGGRIIEEHRITLDTTASEQWEAYAGGTYGWLSADKPLVAAMRAFVAASIGHEVDIPDELMED